MVLRLLVVAITISAAAGWADSRVPVVVELFTSEGCSSCPPADILLQRLVGDMPSGVEVIPLSEHVDYWDHLGWRDRFSSPLFSARQQAYGEVFKTESVYTPQMIVDGVAAFNGSDSRRAHDAIKYASEQPKATVQVRKADGEGKISVRVERLAAAKVERADVFLAVTEHRLSTLAESGENAGQKLSHTGVVRSLTRIVEIEARRGDYVADLKVQLQPDWRRDNVRAVVLVQDRKTRRIVGAAACAL